jgi:O-antigen/teichoic acid export membrane protein
MENTSHENNKRIAKNTMFLYFRSILLLFVGLYTSREVLAQLGVSDFGIYNVVGGVILLFSFIQGAMSSATSRFFTFDLGKGDFEQLKKTFSLSVVIHIFTALLILVLGETIGLWFLNTQLVIPDERMDAANFVYQFSVLSACVGILQVPYMVAINAHERMKVYAYFGIADAVFKLAIVISLGFAPIDKLEFYSVLLFAVYVAMVGFYWIYCHKSFPETHFKWFWDKRMFLERMGFGGWTTLSGISAIAALQGVNMLSNIFHGVTANAALGVMNQVSNAVAQFIGNFSAAINPQITKSYAKDDFFYLHSLIFRSTKFMFFLTFAVAVPLILNMDFILRLWLKNVPPFAVSLCQGILVYNLIVALCSATGISIIATGKIKKISIGNYILSGFNFFVIYILFRNGFSPETIPIVYSIMGFLNFMHILHLSRIAIRLPFLKFFKDVLLKLILIFCITMPLPIWISLRFDNWQALFATSGIFFLLFAPSVFLIGFSSNEQKFLIEKFKFKFCQKIQN